MKHLTTLLIFFGIYCQIAYTQSVGIAETEIVPHESAALEIRSTTKGLLIPRLTYIQRNAISNPADGLLVYQTDGTPGFYYSDGTGWHYLTYSSQPDDLDSDPTNELQEISIIGDTIYLSKGGGKVPLPESGAGTDEQILDIAGDTLSISNGNWIRLPLVSDNLGNHEATQNILLHNFYLSADGDDEGLSIATSGNASFSNDLDVTGDANLSVLNVSSTVNLGANAVQATELDAGSVTNSKIADNAITTAKIQDAQITAAKLHPMGASTDQFLRFNGTSWAPASISTGLSYRGTWDASTNTPVINDATGLNGQYYIVSIAGSQNLGSGVISFDVGDWAIHDGVSYQKINNSNDVNSVFGRTGIITPQYGDYSWNLLDLTSSDIDDLSNVDASSVSAGNLLINDGSNWVSSSLTGDVTLDATGNMQIKNSVISYANLQDATGPDNTILKWDGSQWEEILLSTAEVDGDPTNELQSLGLSGNVLSISDGNTVNLSAFKDNTDAQTLSLSSNTLGISGGNTVDLSGYLDNTDAQTLNISTNTLGISGGNSVDLSPYLDNTDAQDLSLSGTTLSLTGDASSVDLSPILGVNTDNQTLSLSNDTLYIENGNEVFLGPYVNTDAQTLSFSSNILGISGGNTVDLSGYLDNTDAQTLSLSSNTLGISGGNSVDLSPYLDNTDAQDLSLLGTTLSLTGDASSVDLSGLQDNLGNHTATENIISNGNFLSGDGDNEGIYIDANGLVSIGVDKPSYKLHLTESTNSVLRIDNSDPNPVGLLQLAMTTLATPGSGDSFIRFIGAGNTVLGEIVGDGSGGIDYTTISDIRLKENLVPTHYGLGTINKIKVYDYNFIGSDGLNTGFAAQELYKVFPSAVNVGGENPKTNPWSVDYSKITPVLVKAVQEMSDKITKLEEENKKLEQKNSELEHALEKLDILEQKVLELEKKAAGNNTEGT